MTAGLTFTAPLTILADGPRGTGMASAPRHTARYTPDWVRQGVVYEIYPRAFSREGTFRAVQERLPALKRLGATILWLMPIHVIGRAGRKGSLGCPYSVYDYYSVNPEYGTIEDVRSLVADAHRRGMHIIMDLVAGHTSLDSVLVRTHPEWFKRSGTGALLPPQEEWTDVAALDYSQKGLRRYMIAVMAYWAGTVGFDGFRCDDAGRVPLGFWEVARGELARLKPLVMISETDTHPAHHRSAFDLSYATPFYAMLCDALACRVPASALHRPLIREQRSYPDGSLLLRFSSHHDTNTCDGPDSDMFGPAGARLAAVLVSTLSGVPLLFNGQEYGSTRRLSLFEKTTIRGPGAGPTYSFYRRLLALRKKHPALVYGGYVPVHTSNDREVFAFARVLQSSCVLVACNITAKPLGVRLFMPPDCGSAQERVRLSDASTGNVVRTSSRDHCVVDIALLARGWKIFTSIR